MDAYTNLLENLRDAVLHTLENSVAGDCGYGMLTMDCVRRELLMPLLFPFGDEESQLAKLRSSGDRQLAERLKILADLARPDNSDLTAFPDGEKPNLQVGTAPSLQAVYPRDADFDFWDEDPELW